MKNQEDTIRFITEKLGVTREDLEARLRRSKGIGTVSAHRFERRCRYRKTISLLKRTGAIIRKSSWVPEPRRLYRYGKLAAHLLGYVGEISEKELASNIFPGRRVRIAGRDRAGLNGPTIRILYRQRWSAPGSGRQHGAGSRPFGRNRFGYRR